MRLPSFFSNDKTALCILVLFLTGLGLISLQLRDVRDDDPDKKTIAAKGDNPGIFSRGERMPVAFLGELETNWVATVEYMPEAGSLEVDLSHRDIPVDAALKVRANFTANRSNQRIGSRWLIREKNGVYRAGGLHLSPGNWTMGLTGYLRSKIAFRIEQVVDVK